MLLEMTRVIPPKLRQPVENVLVLWNMQGLEPAILVWECGVNSKARNHIVRKASIASVS